MSSPLIQEGLAALRDGDAATARRVLEMAVTEVESGEALEGLAEALYLEREYAASAVRYERAYAAYRRDRQRMAAGRAARTVAWITGTSSATGPCEADGSREPRPSSRRPARIGPSKVGC